MAIQARKLPATYERIREWMLYDGPAQRPSAPALWEEDKVVYARLLQLRALYFQKSKSYHEAMLIMCETYDISEATFNRDHHGLIYIFGDLEAESREFDKQRIKEMLLRAYRMAEEKQDSKGMTAAAAQLLKLGGHDREERDAVPLELLNPGAYVLMVSEEDKQLIRNALMSGEGVIDVDSMNKSAAMQVEDIEHEDVTPKATGK